MSSRIEELDVIVRQFDLNEHPFYTEWRAGTLPGRAPLRVRRRVAPFIAISTRAGIDIGYAELRGRGA